MGHAYPYLNDLERRCIDRHFNAYAMSGRVATRAYPDPLCKGAQEWLEAFSLDNGQWVLLKKEESIMEPDRIGQLILRRDMGLFDAVHEMAQFEADKAQSGIEALQDTRHRYFKDMAEAAGLAFDVNGLPHPTEGGQVMGDCFFPKAVYDRAEDAAAKRLQTAKSPVPALMGQPALRTGPVYFEEAAQLAELVQQMERADKIMDEIENRTDGAAHTAILYGMGSSSNLGKALDVQLATCSQTVKSIVQSEIMKKAFDPEVLSWLSEAVLAHGYFVRVSVAQKTMHTLKFQGHDEYLRRIIKEAAGSLAILTGVPTEEALKTVQRKALNGTKGRYSYASREPDGSRTLIQWVRDLHADLVARSAEAPAAPRAVTRIGGRMTPFV